MDCYIDQTFGGVLAHAIVAITPQFPGHGKRVGRTVADIAPAKRVMVVDADVEHPRPSHVDWALNSRFSPQRDTVIIDDVYVPLQIDPSVRDARGNVYKAPRLFSMPRRRSMPGASRCRRRI